WRTRHVRSLNTYLRGNASAGWGTIGLSVMATQASAITFLSIPGQGFESGVGFVQNYFGLPLALIVVCAVFLPMYRRLNVYTAYGFLGAAHVAGALGKLQAVDFSLDPSRRYTVWTGVFGGLFLSLAYFGTDQSQVQRYIGGASLREGRLGLMFNAVLKIPMQFIIL